MSTKGESFIKSYQERTETLGFWDETYKSRLIHQMEIMYKPEILKEWGISDLVIDGDKVLVKWFKRRFVLSPNELKEEYGFKVSHNNIKKDGTK